jgi:protein gp37
MGKRTKIAWTESSWSPWWGCTPVSAGCEHCYAASFARRIGHDCFGANKPRRMMSEAHWREPLRWDAKAAMEGRIQTNFPSMCDPFEDLPELRAPLARLWSLFPQTPHTRWLLLTKRPENADKLAQRAATAILNDEFPPPCPIWPDNVWLGVTGEDQPNLDRRLANALAVPASYRFLSLEPLLGEIRLPSFPMTAGGIRWVIAGGESGPHARPCNVSWLRSIRDQCKASGVAFFCKQLGDDCRWDGIHGEYWPDGTITEDTLQGDFRVHLRTRAGANPTEWPEDLRVREVAWRER